MMHRPIWMARHKFIDYYDPLNMKYYEGDEHRYYSFTRVRSMENSVGNYSRDGSLYVVKHKELINKFNAELYS